MYLLLVVSLLLTILSCSYATKRIVELPNGQLQGVLIENYYSFTNVRYAEPAIRYEPSKPYNTIWRGIQKATSEMIRCIQFRPENVSGGQEDCLFLNIFVPQKATLNNPLPVFVYIHGGAFMFGGAPTFSPKIIMDQGSMVLVTMNYRLGPLGFLAAEDERIHGNLGLKDQLLALIWIKKNIHCFGGDPENILLAGQSAGGASVHLHILKKETENLISAAVSISGSALNPWVMQKDAKKKTRTFAALLNCPMNRDELKSCLQAQPIEKLYAAFLKMYKYLDNPFNLFGIIVEKEDTPNAFLTKEPRSLIERGEIANIPYMITMTVDEGAYNAASLLRRNANGREYIYDLNERWFELAPYLLFYYDESCEYKHKLSENLKEFYMGKQRFSIRSYFQLQKMFGDVIFINGILETINLHRIRGPSPVYAYIYANPHNYGIGNFLADNFTIEFGATHGDDQMHFLPFSFIRNYTAKPNDAKISKHFIKMFESFMIEGTPRFKNTRLPVNRNSVEPIQFLQIFEKNYCVGPWTSCSNQKY